MRYTHFVVLLVLQLLPTSIASMSEQFLFDEPPSSYEPQATNSPSLADLLTIENSASIFYSYARETRLSEFFGDDGSYVTLFVPNNRAVMALARKPYV